MTVNSAAPPRTSTSPRLIGLNLDPCGVESYGLQRSETTPSEPTESEVASIPPAVLLPQYAGEPVRTDLAYPPHVRGSGRDWPPSGRVDPDDGSARWPLAYVWPALFTGDTWTWHHNNHDATCTAAEALAAAVGAATAGHVHDSNERQRVALLVPNALPESGQQALLEATRRLGLDVHLLWRPVAAALAWLEQYENDIDPLGHEVDQSVGSLLCLHIGLGSVEATLLDLVVQEHDGKRMLVPGRQRPATGAFLPAAMLPTVEAMIAHCLAPRGMPDYQAFWNRAWSGPLLGNLLDQLAEDPSMAPESLRGLSPRWAELVADPAAAEALVSKMRSFADRRTQVKPTNQPRLEKWARKISALEPATKPLVGTVVTGRLAATRGQERRLADWMLQCANIKRERVLIESVDLPRRALARQAAIYLDRLEGDEPTYLDTLPQVHIATLKQGDPAWMPLLATDDRWVQGGREWRRDPSELSGFHVSVDEATRPQRTASLRISLNHEEEPEQVREVQVTASLPEQTDCRRIPVQLAVSVTPAQGAARVQVVPEAPGALGRRPVVVDWKRMTRTGKSPQAYLASMPRICPPVMPRHASRDCWRRAIRMIRDLVNRGGPTSRTRPDRLQELGNALNQIDQQFQVDRQTGSRYATALSSEGRPPGELSCPDLEMLVERLVDQLPRPTQPLDDRSKQVVRVLGFSSTAHPAFQAFLGNTLWQRSWDVEPEIQRAVGWCLRRPEDFAVLAELCSKIHRTTNYLTLEWIKALAQVARYRPDATRDLPSPLGHRLGEVLGEAFQAERKDGKGKQRFRWAAVGIVFLLRRRAFDDTFLAPDSKLAELLKQEFATAYFTSTQLARRTARTKQLSEQFPEIARRCANHRNTLVVQGGAIDVQAALAQLIDYIDRRGTGYIQFSRND